MNGHIAPLTHFAGIPLTILSDEGRVQDWHRELIVNEEKVPSSDSTIRQFDGYRDWTYETRVLFASVEDWQRFDALRGTRASLRHLASTSATVPTASRYHQLGDDYVTWPNVTYVRLVDPPRRLRDGRVLARVVFVRGNG